jgi:phosphohistidine phosphatase SixA
MSEAGAYFVGTPYRKAMRILMRFQFLGLVTGLWLGSAAAQSLPSDSIAALRAGGHTFVMRHAHSPSERPDAASAHPGNVRLERQLDAEGRAAAVAMGVALRNLGIPIGEILTSPTFRALETVRALDLGDSRPVEALGDGGLDMQPDVEGKRPAWLRAKASEAPPASSNVLLITHLPNLRGAFGDDAADMADGETLILRPGGGEVAVVGRVRIDEWSALATD